MGNDNFSLGPIYEGLIENEEYKRIAEENSYKNRTLNGIESFNNRTGIHSRTGEEHAEAGKKGVVSQGRKPYSEQDLEILRELLNSEEYHNDSNGKTRKYVNKLTRHYNLITGQERTRNSLIDLIKRKL